MTAKKIVRTISFIKILRAFPPIHYTFFGPARELFNFESSIAPETGQCVKKGEFFGRSLSLSSFHQIGLGVQGHIFTKLVALSMGK